MARRHTASQQMESGLELSLAYPQCKQDGFPGALGSSQTRSLGTSDRMKLDKPYQPSHAFSYAENSVCVQVPEFAVCRQTRFVICKCTVNVY